MSIPDPGHSVASNLNLGSEIRDGKSGSWIPVLRIRDILVRIQIRGSVPLTNGSGSGSCYFRRFFCLLLFEAAFIY
jgi:hypothetical protein